MKILKATVIVGRGADKVMLHTDLPEACYPYNGFLCLDFNVAQHGGKAYVEQWFPFIEVKVIDCK